MKPENYTDAIDPLYVVKQNSGKASCPQARIAAQSIEARVTYTALP